MASLASRRCLRALRLAAPQELEQTSLVPAWVKVLCPNVTKLDLSESTISPRPLHQAMPHQHLQQLEWQREHVPDDERPVAEHVRQQLAALPSLTSLALFDVPWAQEEKEERARRLVSSSVTRLGLLRDLPEGPAVDSIHLHRLPSQLPSLRELQASRFVVDDLGLGLMHRFAAHQPRLTARSINLKISHAHGPWPWRKVEVFELDVASFARLPLDRIQGCTVHEEVRPSADMAAVERVARAAMRWGGLEDEERGYRWHFLGADVPALLTTLGPMVAALPAEAGCHVTISGLQDTTPQQVQQLGQHLPASVKRLYLEQYALAPDAWPALLPSLPATVEELELGLLQPFVPEERVLALCQAAVRPVTVRVPTKGRLLTGGLAQEEIDRIRAALAGGGAQGGGLVTLDTWGPF